MTASLTWLGHWISHANARRAATLQIDEKAALVDVREFHVAISATGDRRLTFALRNFGTAGARYVLITVNGRVASYEPVLVTDDRPVISFELPGTGNLDDIHVRLAYRDHGGRRRR